MSPRTVLITGAGSGIGRATALLLSKAQDMFKVVATDVNTEKLGSLIEESPDIRAEVMDVTNEADIETIIPGVARSENGLHVLINNAGIMGLGPVEMMPEELHRKVFEVNYWGTVRCSRAAVPYMRDSAASVAPLRPRVVNISSIGGLVSLPFVGVDVSLVEPAAMESNITSFADMTVREILDGATDEYNQELADMLKTVYPNLRESLSAERGAQQPVEVAEVIKSILTAEHPHLRNITQKKYSRRLIAVKYHDTAGDKTLEAIRDFVEKNWHISRDFKRVEPPEAHEHQPHETKAHDKQGLGQPVGQHHGEEGVREDKGMRDGGYD